MIRPYKKYPPIVRIVSAILIVAFFAQDIVWAYPDIARQGNLQSQTLAPQSFFRDKGSIVEMMRIIMEREHGINPSMLRFETLKHIISKYSNWFHGYADIIESENELKIAFVDAGVILRYYATGDGYVKSEFLDPSLYRPLSNDLSDRFPDLAGKRPIINIILSGAVLAIALTTMTAYHLGISARAVWISLITICSIFVGARLMLMLKIFYYATEGNSDDVLGRIYVKSAKELIEYKVRSIIIPFFNIINMSLLKVKAINGRTSRRITDNIYYPVAKALAWLLSFIIPISQKRMDPDHRTRRVFGQIVGLYKAVLTIDLVVPRKLLLKNLILAHITPPEGDARQSPLRNKVAHDFLIDHIFASSDPHIFEPALEAIIELLAKEKETNRNYFFERFFPLLDGSGKLPNFSRALIDVLFKAQRGEVELYDIKNPEVFLSGCKEIIKDLARSNWKLRKEILIHLFSAADHRGETELAYKLLAELEFHIVSTDEFVSAAAHNVAAEIIGLQNDPSKTVNILLTAGETMIEFLDHLAQEEGIYWSRVRVFQLCEFGGLSKLDRYSNAAILEKHLISKVMPLSWNKAYLIDGKNPDPDHVKRLNDLGRADIAVLGIGTNGRIGLNEPGVPWHLEEGHLRFNKLDRKALTASMQAEIAKDIYGYTMSVDDILKSRKIFLLARGKSKAQKAKEAFTGSVGWDMPASSLQQHPNVTVVVDQDAADDMSADILSRMTKQMQRRAEIIFAPEKTAYHVIDRDGYIKQVSQLEAGLLGHEVSEMLNRPVWSFIAPTHYAIVKEAIMKKMATVYGDIPPVVRPYTKKDGSTIWVEIKDTQILDASGRPLEMLSIMRPVDKPSQLPDVPAKSALQSKLSEKIAGAMAEQSEYPEQHFNIDDDGNIIILTVDDKNGIRVGNLIAFIRANENNEHELVISVGPEGREAVYVVPEYRHSGIGTAMVKSLIKYVKQIYPYIVRCVAEKVYGKYAPEMLKKAGFSPVGNMVGTWQCNLAMGDISQRKGSVSSGATRRDGLDQSAGSELNGPSAISTVTKLDIPVMLTTKLMSLPVISRKDPSVGSFKVCGVQLKEGSFLDNTRTMREIVEGMGRWEAWKPDIALFPESMDDIYSINVEPDERMAVLQEISDMTGIAIGYFIESRRDEERIAPYNRTYTILRPNKSPLIFKKFNADNEMRLFEINGKKAVLLICYENNIPAMGAADAKTDKMLREADVILMPSGTDDAAMPSRQMKLARHYGKPVVFVNFGGGKVLNRPASSFVFGAEESVRYRLSLGDEDSILYADAGDYRHVNYIEPNPAEREKWLKNAENAAQTATGPILEVNIKDLLEEIIIKWRLRSEANITLDAMDTPDRILLADHQKNMLTNILPELIVNAGYYAKDGGANICIRIERGQLVINIKNKGDIDFEKLAENMRAAAEEGAVFEGKNDNLPLIGNPVSIPSSGLAVRSMSPEEVDAFINAHRSELPFVRGLTLDGARMRRFTNGIGLYNSRYFARTIDADIVYKTGSGETTVTLSITLPQAEPGSVSFGATRRDGLDQSAGSELNGPMSEEARDGVALKGPSPKPADELSPSDLTQDVDARNLTYGTRRAVIYDRMKARFAAKGFEINDIIYIMQQHIAGLGESLQTAQKYLSPTHYGEKTLVIPKKYMAKAFSDHRCTYEEGISYVLDELAKNTEHIDIEDKAFLGLKLDKKMGALEIVYYDNGLGNSEAVKNFGEIYSTTNKPNRGYGLRLIKHITETIGGAIHFHSDPRYGHYIRIVLPVKYDLVIDNSDFARGRSAEPGSVSLGATRRDRRDRIAASEINGPLTKAMDRAAGPDTSDKTVFGTSIGSFMDMNRSNFAVRVGSFIIAKNGTGRLEGWQAAELDKFAGLMDDLECFREGVKVFPEFPDGCCVLPSRQALDLLGKNGFDVSLIIRQFPDAGRYIKTHYYLLVRIAGEVFVLDLVPDAFAPKKKIHAAARQEFENTGILMIPNEIVTHPLNSDRFWMYTKGSYGEERYEESGSILEKTISQDGRDRTAVSEVNRPSTVDPVEITRFIKSVEDIFADEFQKHKILLVNNELQCTIKPKILAKAISGIFDIPIGTTNSYRVQAIPGKYFSSDRKKPYYHQWLAVYLGEDEPALFIDPSHRQFDPEERNEIIVGPYRETLAKYNRLREGEKPVEGDSFVTLNNNIETEINRIAAILIEAWRKGSVSLGATRRGEFDQSAGSELNGPSTVASSSPRIEAKADGPSLVALNDASKALDEIYVEEYAKHPEIRALKFKNLGKGTFLPSFDSANIIKILKIIKKARPEAKTFFDFGGGDGRVAILAALCGYEVSAVEWSEDLVQFSEIVLGRLRRILPEKGIYVDLKIDVKQGDAFDSISAGYDIIYMCLGGVVETEKIQDAINGNAGKSAWILVNNPKYPFNRLKPVRWLMLKHPFLFGKAEGKAILYAPIVGNVRHAVPAVEVVSRKIDYAESRNGPEIDLTPASEIVPGANLASDLSPSTSAAYSLAITEKTTVDRDELPGVSEGNSEAKMERFRQWAGEYLKPLKAIRQIFDTAQVPVDEGTRQRVKGLLQKMHEIMASISDKVVKDNVWRAAIHRFKDLYTLSTNPISYALTDVGSSRDKCLDDIDKAIKRAEEFTRFKRFVFDETDHNLNIDECLKSADDVLAEVDVLTAKVLAEHKLTDGARIILSESLFAPNEAEQLRSVLRGKFGDNSPIKVIAAKDMQTEVNRRPGKERAGCVLSKEDYDNLSLWNGLSDKATVLVLGEDLQGDRYLHIEGVIGLVRAMMAGEASRSTLAGFMGLLFRKVEDMDSAALVELLLTDPRKFADRVKFKPVNPADVDGLDQRYRIAVETYLVNA